MKHFQLGDCPTLSNLLMEADIKLVDIGGRGSAMPQLTALASVAHYFACEPEAEEAERLRGALPQEAPWRSVTVMTEACASQSGEATLYLTQNPGMSSLLEPDPAVFDRISLGPKFRPIGLATVPTITLDEAARRYGFEDACFLKIDTQGTELDILRSGATTLARSVVGVYLRDPLKMDW